MHIKVAPKLNEDSNVKIGLVCPYNIFKGGGVQECVLAMAQELNSRGHTVKIITPFPIENGIKTSKDGIIFVGRSKDVKSPFATTAQVSVSLNKTELDEIESEGFDILHFHEPWVPILSNQILSRSKSANIATFHAKLPDTMLAKTIEKVVTPYTKSIIKYLHALSAVSDSAADYVRSITDHKINMIPNGIHLDEYQFSDHTNNQNNKILYVGRLEKRKGVKYLLLAFERLVKKLPQAELVLAGDGVDRKKLEKLVSDKKIPNVSFLGYVDDDKKKELFKNADLFVSPALYGESFGIVLLESMASGLPLVAGNNPGYSGVLSSYGSNCLVDPADTTAFEDKIYQFLSDKDARSQWVDWAKSEVVRYDYSKVVDAYEQLYQQTLKSKMS